MSTRAVYSFIGPEFDGGPAITHHVYKHHDGYPSGAAEAIRNATNSAWKLPRFEPDEFGASFIAANKNGSGGLRLTRGPEAHGDLEYRYEIRCVDGALQVTAFDVPFGDAKETEIFKGTLDALEKWVEKGDAA